MPGVEQQLGQRAVRLGEPDHGADLVREVAGLPGGGEGLLVAVQVAQHEGLVDLEQ